jgi:dolichol-phosphate mannosyltransferase
MFAPVTREWACEVSVVVPCYNESTSIADVIERICKYLDTLGSRVSSEVVAVDDGSSDDTASVLQYVSTKYPGRVSVVRHTRNAGLTRAMRTGAENASKNTVVFLDADLSYAPEIIGELLSAKSQTGAAVAVASPYMPGGRTGNVPFVRLAASRGANWLLALTVGRKIHTFTGMVRAYDRAVFRELAGRVAGGEFNSAMIAEALRAGLGVVEVPAALVWPEERTAAAPRISGKQLRGRTRLVVETLGVLANSGKGFVKNADSGPLDLVQRPKGPYSPPSD